MSRKSRAQRYREGNATRNEHAKMEPQEIAEGTPIQELRLAHKAFNADWPITEEYKQKAIEKAIALLDSDSQKTRLHAVRVLVAADALNARRQANRIEERHNEFVEATTTLREAMKSPAMREKLAAISDQMCGLPEPLKIEHVNGTANGTNGKPHEST